MITLSICWEAVIITLVSIILIAAFVILLIAALEAATDGKLWGKIVLGIIILGVAFIVFGVIYTTAAMELCH